MQGERFQEPCLTERAGVLGIESEFGSERLYSLFGGGIVAAIEHPMFMS
jgi:hypothetical protein